ncbi:MAG: hypothetical protein Q8S33_18655 [Myxococcales bacterium]|nr:hypothetical protein [Myxococcales bacterium]MDP3502363.1 hypothetical protein [Myxococcales bacterium]
MLAPEDRRWTVVTLLSVALLFFSIPHVLEDFALGEPLKRGVPPAAIAFVVSVLLGAQGLGLHALGRRSVAGLGVHAGLGLLWAVAAGMAQLPELLESTAYRSGFISAAYVIGVIGVGLALSLVSLLALLRSR